MKQITFTFLALILLISGKNVFAEKTVIRNVGRSFTGIDVSAGIELYITMGETEEVKIVADDDIIDKIITEVEGGTLKIYVKQNNWFNWSGNEKRKAYVKVKEVKVIDASAGCDVKSENTLKGEELKVSASSGSDLNLDVYYKNLNVDTSSGSDAKLTGKVKYLTASSSSGSDLDARNLESVICKVSVSSGSDATVNVSEEIQAHASSGGDIDYYGNPSVKDIDESSGGDVSHK
jgi:hypothetical protein